MNEYLTWDDLTEAEKEQATESYIGIREWEEGRGRNETNEEYTEPINADILTECRFERTESGYIVINI